MTEDFAWSYCTDEITTVNKLYDRRELKNTIHKRVLKSHKYSYNMIRYV